MVVMDGLVCPDCHGKDLTVNRDIDSERYDGRLECNDCDYTVEVTDVKMTEALNNDNK